MLITGFYMIETSVMKNADYGYYMIETSVMKNADCWFLYDRDLRHASFPMFIIL